MPSAKKYKPSLETTPEVSFFIHPFLCFFVSSFLLSFCISFFLSAFLLFHAFIPSYGLSSFLIVSFIHYCIVYIPLLIQFVSTLQVVLVTQSTDVKVESTDEAKEENVTSPPKKKVEEMDEVSVFIWNFIQWYNTVL